MFFPPSCSVCHATVLPKVTDNTRVSFFAATMNVSFNRSYDKWHPVTPQKHAHAHTCPAYTQQCYCHPSVEWRCDFYQPCYCQLFFRMELHLSADLWSPRTRTPLRGGLHQSASLDEPAVLCCTLCTLWGATSLASLREPWVSSSAAFETRLSSPPAHTHTHCSGVLVDVVHAGADLCARCIRAWV